MLFLPAPAHPCQKSWSQRTYTRLLRLVAGDRSISNAITIPTIGTSVQRPWNQCCTAVYQSSVVGRNRNPSTGQSAMWKMPLNQRVNSHRMTTTTRGAPSARIANRQGMRDSGSAVETLTILPAVFAPEASMRVIPLFSIAVLALLVASCATAPPRPTPRIERIEFARAGTDGVHGFRTPSLAVARDGTLIAGYSALLHSENDLPNDIQVWVRSSHDDGLHWSAPQRLTHPAGGAGSSDTSLLVDRDTGRVFLFYNYGPPGIGFWNSAAGTAPTRTLHPRYLWSDDDGRTWLGPRDLLTTVKQPGWHGLFTASGNGVQLQAGPHRGRLLQPLVYRLADGRIHAANIYSDDHGKTWHVGASIGANLDESKAVQLANGEVMQNLRSDDAHVHARVVALSHDGGVHFGSPRVDKQLPDPHVNASSIRAEPQASASRAASHWLLFSNPADPAQRRNLTVRLSCDDGKTWAASRVLDPGPSMYSVMARLPDGDFGIIWEDGSGDLFYARFNLAWVARGAPCG
ncbi:MAG: exo-alpha-sialidase [Rhodanobacteraceae bacterium]|nr:MAG: exo-alpha-sialidase [Rhodanobacteraceae bacterium]